MNNNYYLLTNLLSEKEQSVIMSIVKHIEKDPTKVGIQQIANENYVSTSFVMKLCKRLGFSGYSELYYTLIKNVETMINEKSDRFETIKNLVDNYDEEQVERFCDILKDCKERKIFVVGAGFAGTVAEYMVERLAVCGFMVFNRVHFYDLMMFNSSVDKRMVTNIEPSVIIAISQSGETETVLENVSEAKKYGFKAVTFSRRDETSLSKLSDINFVIDASKQTLIGELPNPFFGKVILVFEELIAACLG